MKTKLSGLLLFSLFTTVVMADTESHLPGFEGGHAKYALQLTSFNNDSLFDNYSNSPFIDQNIDLRIKFKGYFENASLVSDYQLITSVGDSISMANNSPAQINHAKSSINDDNRLLNLTHSISESDNSFVTHRLDRLFIDYSGESSVIRFGRQAVSWGNGLIFNPMDFFNPFDPAAIDKEYKTGDDMLYGQYLQSSGNDIQVVWVIRRDQNDDIANDVKSVAIKYHGFLESNEYDLLLAQHYNETILGLGGITDVKGAVWRGDITFTDSVISLVSSLSYSWMSWGHNVSGTVEIFHNGFGQSDGNYNPTELANNIDLVQRIARGELFTLGKQYLAASAMVEITPLLIVTPNIFYNLNDQSMLLQITSTYDLKQDWQLQTAIGIPMGASDSEYGGIESVVAGKDLSTEFTLFAQVAWYF